ncbi:unnamed protein product [Rhizopus stolonifer]
MINVVHPRAVVRFYYQYYDPTEARIYTSFKVKDLERKSKKVLEGCRREGMKEYDVSDNELAKTHARYMMGGSRPVNERMLDSSSLKD